ncbi:MAG: bifunctional ADP-dependent (S)-NAD(P)H-hydrate dehydratase/NAD(P)H-hydrate epimerase [Gammaproteobacteria bacterium]|nr:bifunctional ADP-dependent (S)-NAD(P)H-hydrate dehydratase/NAD(P)H-hydrate epimerase [Gammaproteobacteria bacterium]
MSLPTSLYRADQVRELDRRAGTELNIDGFNLMQRAGRSAWEILQGNWPQARHLCVLCGGGNNGGDGYILAGLALEAGLQVNAMSTVDPAGLSGDARQAYQQFMGRSGAECRQFSPATLGDADVVIDSLLGTGLDREVTGIFREAITAINGSGKPILALDIPSGLHADSGAVMGVAVRATITVTFVGLKQGLFTGQGRGCSGRLYFADLALPELIFQQVKPAALRMDFSSQSRLLQPRSRHAHKGHFGHVLVIGGDYGYAGAARMAAEAAARSGAGLVSVATRPEHALGIPMAIPEIMAHGIEKTIDLQPLLDRATVVAIGPGLGQSAWASNLLARVLETHLPLVLDADALNLLARDPIASDRWILTPHPGEAASLLQTTTSAIAADRFACVRSLREKFGGIVVLKGSGTLVADETMLYLCSEGNPGMASGGMGDVLTGIIAGLVAQNIGLADAARLGVCLHAAAADAAAADGERGMLATDLMPWLRKLIN